MARLYRIIYVTGMKPKPPPADHRAALLRALTMALARVRPEAAALAVREECFTLVPWTRLLYAGTRDIGRDLAGLERLLRSATPDAQERREIDALHRSFVRLWRRVGDSITPLTGLMAGAELRQTLADVRRYLVDAEGFGTAVRALVKSALTGAWAGGERVLLIGHSLGSVIAYDSLWELSRIDAVEGRVEEFVTLGSPLATRYIRRGLKGADLPAPERYPTNIRHWTNFTARGEMVALHGRLEPFFRGMVAQRLVEAIEDRVDLYNHFHGEAGIEPHKCYAYLGNAEVASVIGAWLVK
jgi:hypothetical protein